MTLIVKKYGGTSVGSPERICHVADQIARSYQTGESLVIVVSAMGDTTDELIHLAYRVSRRPPHREMDMLLSAGERISMALLSMALEERNIPAVSFTGSQTGIITNNSHRRAKIHHILGDRVRAALAEKKVVIVAGFQGVSSSKEITTLGRGGSDTTAVALAASLGAKACEIYTDVDGVFSADPRKVLAAKRYAQIPYDLMVELAIRGAGVLHPRSVELASQYQVPLWVKNSFFEEREGTCMVQMDVLPSSIGMENYQVVGVTSDSAQFLVSVELSPEGLTPFLEQVGKLHLTLMGVVLQKDLQGTKQHLQFFAYRETEDEWNFVLDAGRKSGWILDHHSHLDIIPLSLVGYRFSQDSLFFFEVLQLLEKDQIPIYFSLVSSLSICLGIKNNLVEKATKILHSTFLERKESHV